MSFPVFDLHCDTALELLGKNLRSPLSLKENKLHIDLQRAKQLPGLVQCFACFTTPDMEKWFGISAEMVFQLELDVILAELEKNKRTIRQVYTADDIRANMEKGKMSAILTIEGPAGFGYDPALLEQLYAVGFRITTLGWNENSPLCGSHKTGGGLTKLGSEYFREAQRVGMIVDVSHCSDEAFWDMIDIAEKPIIASHSNARAVCDVSRNLTDDMFRAICATGGVVGINQYAEFLGENPDLDTICDHIEHFITMDPNAEHIALGGDLDGCDTLAEGFTGIESYPVLAQRLLQRGLTEKMVENIYFNNAMGVFEKCCM